MKSWIRRIAIAAFVLSFAPMIPKVGKVLAQTAPDFTFVANGTKGQITYETANCGNSTSQVISCQSPFTESDSYSVNAGINVANGTDLGQDLTNNGLLVMLFPGSDCNGDLLSAQIIPGNAMHTTGNKKWTIYAFEGNVPSLLFTYGRYDHLEMNLMVNHNDPTQSALHIEANANLCNWSNNALVPMTAGQPVSMLFAVGNIGVPLEASDLDDNGGDGDCVTFTPSYSTKDVSSAACFEGP